MARIYRNSDMLKFRYANKCNKARQIQHFDTIAACLYTLCLRIQKSYCNFASDIRQAVACDLSYMLLFSLGENWKFDTSC